MNSKIRDIIDNLNIKKLLPVLILVASSLMSVGYAVINGVALEITGTASAISQNNIFITDIEYKTSNNSYKELSEINDYYQTMLNTRIVLGESQDSSITYTITFYNKNDYDMAFHEITHDDIEQFYSNQDIIVLSSIQPGTLIKSKEYLSLDITYKYKEGINPTNFELLSYINFKFCRAYDVTYENIALNNYPLRAYDGTQLDIVFTNDIPNYVKVEMNGVTLTKKDYSYVNPILHINQVTGNIVIKKISSSSDVVLLDNVLTEGCPSTSDASSNYVKIENDPSIDSVPNQQFCATQDDYGSTYYFRGDTKNNYITFAGKTWRIMRINGDGSLRLILNDTIGTSAFTDSATDNADVGYLSGTRGQTTYDSTHTNSNQTAISNFINNWYEQNILGKYSTYVSDTYFCNDRSVNDGVHGNYNDIVFNPYMANYCLADKGKKVCRGEDTARGYGNQTTYYGAWYRFVENTERQKLQELIDQGVVTASENEIDSQELTESLTGYATYKCHNKNDRLTVNDTKIGNGKLRYPISLPSADDIAFAGVTYSDIKTNPSCYLTIDSSSSRFWTMSPGDAYGSFNGAMCTYLYTGWMSCATPLTFKYDVRPVINIKGSTAISSGDGTSNNPYVLDTPYIEYNITISGNTDVTASYTRTTEGTRVELSTGSTGKEIQSFLLNGVKYEGSSFIMPGENVTITDIKFIGDDLIDLNISMVNKFTWSEPYYSMLVYSAGASTVKSVTGQSTLTAWTYIKVENGVVTDVVASGTEKGNLSVPALGSSNNSYVIISYESTAKQVGVGSTVQTKNISGFTQYNGQVRPSQPYGKINIYKKV